VNKQKRAGAGDFWFLAGTGSFALVLVAIVVGVAAVLCIRSASSIRTFGFHFWITDVWDPVAEQFGARPFIWGTLYSSFLAVLISTPIAIGIAIFLSEMCPHWLRQPLSFLTELLAAIPSIVYGLWGIFVLVPAIRSFELMFPDWLRALPLFSGPPVGVGMLSAAVILAIMIVPFSSSVAREVMKAVPNAQREAAYALGSTRWEATIVAIYYARTGITGAVILGLGRALGETMAVTMVIGFS
jgi:phosphate transport system permease protein